MDMDELEVLLQIRATNKEVVGMTNIEPSDEAYFGKKLRATAPPSMHPMKLVDAQALSMRLYESRVASLQRAVAFYVLFHKLGQTVADWWPRWTLGLFKYRIDRTHSIMRIATTASPVSGAEVRDRMFHMALEKQWKRAIDTISLMTREFKKRNDERRLLAKHGLGGLSPSDSVDNQLSGQLSQRIDNIHTFHTEDAMRSEKRINVLEELLHKKQTQVDPQLPTLAARIAALCVSDLARSVAERLEPAFEAYFGTAAELLEPSGRSSAVEWMDDAAIKMAHEESLKFAAGALAAASTAGSDLLAEENVTGRLASSPGFALQNLAAAERVVHEFASGAVAACYDVIPEPYQAGMRLHAVAFVRGFVAPRLVIALLEAAHSTLRDAANAKTIRKDLGTEKRRAAAITRLRDAGISETTVESDVALALESQLATLAARVASGPSALGTNTNEREAAAAAAAARGDVDKLREIHEQDADVDLGHGDYDERTPLHLGASEGRLEVVKFLVLKANVNINHKDRWGGTALDDALRHGHKEVANFLKANHATIGGHQSEKDANADLCDAAARGDVDRMRDLQNAGLDLGAGDYDQRCVFDVLFPSFDLPNLSFLTVPPRCVPFESPHAGRHSISARRRESWRL